MCKRVNTGGCSSVADEGTIIAQQFYKVKEEIGGLSQLPIDPHLPLA